MASARHNCRRAPTQALGARALRKKASLTLRLVGAREARQLNLNYAGAITRPMC